MRVVIKNKNYELVELTEIGMTSTYGIIGVFEVQYATYENNVRKVVSEEEFLNQDEDVFVEEELRFVNYFYGVEDDIETIIANATNIIEREWVDDELKSLLKKVKDTWNLCAKREEIDFEEFEDAEHELLGWVLDNVEGEEE